MKISTYNKIVCIFALINGASAFFYVPDDFDEPEGDGILKGLINAGSNLFSGFSNYWNGPKSQVTLKDSLLEPGDEEKDANETYVIAEPLDDWDNIPVAMAVSTEPIYDKGNIHLLDNDQVKVIDNDDQEQFTFMDSPLRPSNSEKGKGEYSYVLDMAQEAGVSEDQLQKARVMIKKLESEKVKEDGNHMVESVDDKVDSAEDKVSMTEIYNNSASDKIPTSVPKPKTFEDKRSMKNTAFLHHKTAFKDPKLSNFNRWRKPVKTETEQKEQKVETIQ